MADEAQGLIGSLSVIQLKPLKTDVKSNMSLQQAVRDGREEIVRNWLDSVSPRKRKQILNAFDPYGFTAMHYAARFNRFKIMQLLYSEKADPNVKTDVGLSPLHYAARYTPIFTTQGMEEDDAHETTPNTTNNNKQILQLLVLWKVNLNVQDIYGITPLHLACSRGNRAAIEVMLSTNLINVNIQDKQQDTPLHDACLYGDAWIVEKLLDEGADVLITNDENMLPLHIACREGFTDIVKIMLRKRFELCEQMVSAYDDQYNYPLHFACRSGEVEIVKVLFLNKADPNANNENGLTPLHIAAREGFISIAEVLLQYDGLDIDVRDDDLCTPLHLTARHNEIKMIEYLLKKGADLEAQDEDSYTPLLTAVAYGQMEAMNVLLKSSAIVDVVDRNGKSMVFIAAEENQPELLKVLLEGHLADSLCKMTDSTHNTPLHIACRKGNIESVKVLLRSDVVKPDARNEADKTPMHLAASKGHTIVVKEMIRHGLQKSIDLIADEDDDSNTPLHLACINGHYGVAKVLLDAEADPDVRNARHWTPMDCAAAKGWNRTVQLLLEFEADIDPKDKAGVTPLLLACQEGHLKVVEVLLENNAKVSNRNSYNMNALDVAVDNGHKDVAMAIIKSDQMIAALRNQSMYASKPITPMRRIIKRMPDVAEEVFKRCAVSNEDSVNKDDNEFMIRFNYEFLEDFVDEESIGGRITRALTFRRHAHAVSDDQSDTTNTDDVVSVVNDTTTLTKEAGFTNNWGPKGYDKSNHCLHLLANSKSVELLKHPLVTSLLNHKWITYGQTVYFTNLTIYILFVGFLTLFALITLPPESITCIMVRDNISFNSTEDDICDIELNSAERIAIPVSAVIVIIFAFIKLVFEFFQLVKLGFKYFLDWINYIEILLFVGSIAFTLIFFVDCYCPHPVQWQIGALCVFLAWIDLVIIMRKFPITGIYVVMFMNIFYIFLKMAFLAGLLILSFAFSFYMLFHDPRNDVLNIRTPFKDAGRSIIKTMTMTTGEFEYDTIFRQNDNTGDDLQYAFISYVLWVLFLILMPILLTNLLVGLAVDDIKGIQENAELKRLSLRVDLTLSVEELMPLWLRRRFIVGERIIKPNRKLNMFERLWFEGLGFYRFDDLDNITNALDPPMEPIEEVFDQNNDLAKKVDDMQLKLESLVEQNNKLLELVESSITQKTTPTDVATYKTFERSLTSKSISPSPIPNI